MYFSMSERDLDLFQLEELHSGNGYADWFAAKVGIAGYAFETARHSVSATANGANGETDILAFFRKDDERCAVLIEDKISAAFTNRQAERYVERGNELIARSEAASFRTVLVAPAIYIISVPIEDPWNIRMPIEEIEEWFRSRDGHHASWRCVALRSTLDRLSRNSNASSAEVARFSLAFSQYLAEFHAPDLLHNPGKDKSGPIIRFPGSSANKTLWWKVATNQMTLQLMNEYRGLAEQIELPWGVELERAEDHGRKCDYLVATTDVVDLSAPFEEQIGVVENAIQVARNMLTVVQRLDALVNSSASSVGGA